MRTSWLPRLLLLLYLGLLAYLTLISPTYQRPHPGVLIELIPFDSIARDLRAGGRALLVNILGNLAAFLPLGFLVPWIRPGVGLGRVAAICAGVSALVELLQLVVGARVTDVDDVILNTAGGLLGYALFRVVVRGAQQRGRTAKPS